MRKFLIVLMLLVLAATALCVGCTEKIEGSCFDVLLEMQSRGEISMQYSASEFGGVSSVWVSSLSKDGVSFPLGEGQYITYYMNFNKKSDAAYIDFTADPVTYEGTKYYLAGVALNNIPLKTGYKIMFASITYSAGWDSFTLSEERIVITLA